MVFMCQDCFKKAEQQRQLEPKGSRINEAQITEMWAAFGHSIKIGKQFNWTLDVHFDLGGLFGLIPPLAPEPLARECLLRWMHSYRKWTEAHGDQAAYLWKLENVGTAFDEAHAKLHAHLLIYVPPALAKRFKQLQLEWWRKAGMQTAKLSRKEGDRKAIRLTRTRTFEAAKGKMKYVSKDIDESLHQIFKGVIDNRGKPSTKPIAGQIFGTSRNLGPKARRQWQPANDTTAQVAA